MTSANPALAINVSNSTGMVQSQESGYASSPATPCADISIQGDPADIVRWNFILLKEGMCYNTMVDKLLSSFCLSGEDRHVIEQVNFNRHRCERLIKCLLRKAKGLNLCGEFLQKLKECPEHSHLYRNLKRKPTSRANRAFHINGIQLKKIHKNLVAELEPKVITDKLFAENVLSVTEHDDILEERTRSRQAHKLLFILEGKSQEKLDTFLDFLDEYHLHVPVKDMLKLQHAAPQNVAKAVTVIRQNFRYVKEQASPYYYLVLDYLIQEGSITDMEQQKIMEIDSKNDVLKCSKMTKIVIQKGKKDCKTFLQAFETPQLDSKFIVDKLKSKIKSDPSSGDTTTSKIPDIPHTAMQVSVLQTHYYYLLEELEVQPLLDVLFEEFLLDVPDHDKVEDERRRRDQTRILLSKVEKVTQDRQKFSYFIWVLSQNGYQHIVEGLKDSSQADSEQEDGMLEAVVDDGVVHVVQKGRIADGRYKLKLSARGGSDVLRQAVEHSIRDTVEHSLGITSLVAPAPRLHQQQTIHPDDHSVSHRGVAIEHDEVDITELCYKFSNMVIDDVSEGSVIIHVHPVTDNALQKLLDAKRNGSLNEFVKSLLRRNKLDQEFAGEVVHIDVQLVKDHEGSSPRRVDKPETKTLSQRISDSMEDLKEEVEPRQIAKILMKRQTISEGECSDILSSRLPRREKVEKLLRLLQEKMQTSDSVEAQFVDTLMDLGYTHVLDLLQLNTKFKHRHAEQVRQGIIEHYSDLLDELGPNLINQMLKRRSIPECMREKLVPKGGKRRKVVVNEFLKETLRDDILVCEFEEFMTDIGMEDLIQSTAPSKQTETETSGELDVTEILLSASFKIKFRRRGDIDVYEPVKDESPKVVVRGTNHTGDCDLLTSRNFGTSWSKKRNIVAAIDFGTAFSGAAFSFKASKDNIIVVRKKVQVAAKYMSEKVPTAVLLGPGDTVLFGWEAQQRYREITESDDEARNHDCYYFKRFKMDLLKTDDLTRETVISDIRGQSMSAMKVFQLAIGSLKERVVEGVKKASPGGKAVRVEDIFWVITVPAIWGDKAKQFMREAAQGAGIQPDRLTFALEPEAAALFIKNSQMERREDSLVKFDAGKKFLVVDLGGGTGDLTSMQVTEDLSLRQLCRSSGGDWGGESINMAFWGILNDIFGADMIREFKQKHQSDYLEMEDDFESKKRSLSEFKEIQIKLPEILIDMTKNEYQKSVEDLLVHKELTSVAGVRGRDRLSLSQKTVRSLFTRTICKLIEEMRQFVHADMDIIMVGGFSDSKIIQNAVRQEYGSHRVIIHSQSGLAVLKGAVYYGHEPSSISSRICKFTYGLEVQRYFLKGDPEKHKTEVEGHPYCTKVFAKIVTVGEEIEIGVSRASEEISALSTQATSMTMKIYKSTQTNPKYVTDPGCNQVGQIRIRTTKKQEVKVWMKFGEAELIVEGRDAGTGELVEGAATLDLLAS